MNKGKNINIELLRCIACYFVIVIHTWGTFRMEGGVFHTEVFVGGNVTRCAVPVFFMITGYVYSNRSSLAHKYKNFVFRVLLPVFLMTFFTAIILARGIHFFLDEGQEYISVMEYIRLIVTGHASDTYLSFHFWYIEELITFIFGYGEKNKTKGKLIPWLFFSGFIYGSYNTPFQTSVVFQ